MTSSNVCSHDTASEGYCTTDDRLDALFDVLSDARRRRTVQLLCSDDRDAVPVSDLAEAVATRERGDPDPHTVATSLRHVHLPKLDAADVVEYAPDRARVRYVGGSAAERLADPD